MEQLNVAFLWHQHQPDYKQTDQNVFLLPWVRFHALKDYYDLVAILDDYPLIHQNFNIVPSLILQLNDYISGSCEDRVEILTRRKAEDLTEPEKINILKYFFQLNHPTMVDKYSDYRSLLRKRGAEFDDVNPGSALKRFSNQDFLDLQVWYNLAWLGEIHKNLTPFKELILKGRNFSEQDKHILLNAQKKILKKIIPKHIEIEKRGQIEISTTPLFHPILPLLCDTDIAKVSQPDIQLPKFRFRYPQYAKDQIMGAINFHQQQFGKKPVGMWPSEGSVSEEVAKLFSQQHVKWIATDEEILFNSWRMMNIHHNMSREHLYSPWEYLTDTGNINIFFRDHTLSDLIGFVYQNWDPEKAANDFIGRLKNIRKSIAEKFGPNQIPASIVSIILDGENCWEYYPDNGKDFLEALYSLLSKTKELKSVTYKEFLTGPVKSEKLTKLFPGSWINHNFAIWIGHPEDNTAWDYLYGAHQVLAQAEQDKQVSKENIDAAKKEIMIAEGSDWCWWYGDDHETENAVEFDQIFRSHIIKVYELLDAQVPAELYDPIRKETHKKNVESEPSGFISPIIDGLESNYFEWMSAGVFDPNRQGTAMHQMVYFVNSIYYGFNLADFYLKVVPHQRYSVEDVLKYEIKISFFEPIAKNITLNLNSLYNRGSEKAEDEIDAAFKNFLELKIPFSYLSCNAGDSVKFQITIIKDDQNIESWPKSGVLGFVAPSPDFEQIEWIV